MEVLTNDNVLIAGFIVAGTDQKQVLLRGLGPELPLTGALADPVMELHNSSATIFTDDNWKDTQQAQIEATGIPPLDDLESAIVATLDAKPAPSSCQYMPLKARSWHLLGEYRSSCEFCDAAQGAPNPQTRGRV